MQEMNIFCKETAIERVKSFFEKGFKEELEKYDAFKNYKVLFSEELEDGRCVVYKVGSDGTVVKRIKMDDNEFDDEILVWRNYNELVNKIFCSEEFTNPIFKLSNGSVNYEKIMRSNLGNTCITDDIEEFVKSEYRNRKKICSDYEMPEPGIYKNDSLILKLPDLRLEYDTFIIALILGKEEDNVVCISLDEFCQNYEKVDLKESVLECAKGLLGEFFGSEEPISIKRMNDGFAYVGTGISVIFEGVNCYFVPYEVKRKDDYGCIFDLPIAMKYCEITEDHFDWLEGYCEELFEVASMITEECDEILFLEEEFKKKFKDLRKCLENHSLRLGGVG